MIQKKGSEASQGLARYYSRLAPTYGWQYCRSYAQYPVKQTILRLVLQLLKRRNVHSVLDCGCGEGTPMVRMMDRGFQVRKCLEMPS